MKNLAWYLLIVAILYELIQSQFSWMIFLPIPLLVVLSVVSANSSELSAQSVMQIILLSIVSGIIYNSNWGFVILIAAGLILIDKIINNLINNNAIKYLILLVLSIVLYQLGMGIYTTLLLFIIRIVLAVVVYLVIQGWQNSDRYSQQKYRL